MTKKAILKTIGIIILMLTLSAEIIILFTLLDSSSIANASSKYTKVKTTTLKKYKKAYTAQPKLKKQISSLKTQVTNLKKSNASAEADVEKYKGINNWLYNTLVDTCGYVYDKSTKTWSCTGYNSITCLDCGTHFAHQPKGEAKYKFCPSCGSQNLDN